MAEAYARSREPLVVEFAEALDQQKLTLSQLLGTYASVGHMARPPADVKEE